MLICKFASKTFVISKALYILLLMSFTKKVNISLHVHWIVNVNDLRIKHSAYMNVCFSICVWHLHVCITCRYIIFFKRWFIRNRNLITCFCLGRYWNWQNCYITTVIKGTLNNCKWSTSIYLVLFKLNETFINFNTMLIIV